MIKDLYIKAGSVGGSNYLSAKMLKTGQTTSYTDGDDGFIKSGRSVDFFTLAFENYFGNTNRFTDENGEQIYSNSVVLDWSTYDGTTVLAYYIGEISAKSWSDACSWALSLTILDKTEWRLTNINELNNIMYYGTSGYELMKYVPFEISGFDYYWTSTTSTSTSSSAFIIGNASGDSVTSSKLGANNTIACIDLIVSEL